ncbi:MAG: response regulator [Planctomycetes bacterium]|nr:response regulator [Planctomycetota bacterium]
MDGASYFMRHDAVILVAEDDDGHFSLIKRNLVRAGISNKIIRLSDGQEALEFLGQLKNSNNPYSRCPCLLLLDIRMPKVDGFEVLKFVKNDPLLKKIPVIILTTAGDQEVFDKCQDYGCNMFIAKPVEYAEFTESIIRISHFISIIEVPSVIT